MTRDKRDFAGLKIISKDLRKALVNSNQCRAKEGRYLDTKGWG